MLLELRVENYAVIDSLAVEFAPGLNLLTGVHAQGGGFHIKTGTCHSAGIILPLRPMRNFPGNPARGLPTIQGVILLFDADNGQVLAVMDSHGDHHIAHGGRDRGSREIPGAEGFPHRYHLRLREPGTRATACDKACLSAGEGFCWDIQKDAAEKFADCHGGRTWDMP